MNFTTSLKEAKKKVRAELKKDKTALPCPKNPLSSGSMTSKSGSIPQRGFFCPLSKRWGYAQRFSDGTRVLREEEVKEAVRRLQDEIKKLNPDEGYWLNEQVKNIFGSLADEVKDD